MQKTTDKVNELLKNSWIASIADLISEEKKLSESVERVREQNAAQVEFGIHKERIWTRHHWHWHIWQTKRTKSLGRGIESFLSWACQRRECDDDEEEEKIVINFDNLCCFLLEYESIRHQLWKLHSHTSTRSKWGTSEKWKMQRFKAAASSLPSWSTSSCHIKHQYLTQLHQS